MADPFDRLLERTMKAEASAAEPCPSADTLAAYVDGVLPTPERQAIERHAADCQTCAEHLALLATLEPVSSSAASPKRAWWRTWTWLVPVAASLVVASVWVSLPREAQVPTAESDRAVATNRPSDASRSAVLPGEPPVPPPAGAAESTTAPAPSAVGGVSWSERKPSLAAKSAPVSLHVAPSVPGERRDRLAALSAQAPAAQSPPAFRIDTDALKRQSADLKDKADEELGQRPEAANTATAAAREAVLPPAQSLPPPAAAPPARPLSAARGAQPESSGFLAKADRKQEAGAAVAFEATDAAGHRWRISGTAIEQSSDSGATWQDAHAPILAGASFISAPAPGVCWVAAPSGDIVRHAPDVGWTRGRVSASSAITALSATSASDAIATSADQRKFETKDGGLTWAQVQK